MASTKPNDADWSFLNPPLVEGDIGTLGGYRILSLIGQGAMGFVFKALDIDLQRIIALKVMRPAVATTPNSRDRLLREARAAAGIQSENVVTVFQVGEDHGIPFIAMEFLEGLTLEAWQTRQKKVVPMGAVCRVARDLLRGLAAAHEKGLIHRDIKPGNLWVDQKSGRIKILDFGLTRSTESQENLTLDGSILGTPAYMSPEQAGGNSADARSDLFSAGTVLYHLVTGSSPFQRSGLLPTLGAVANHKPLPIRSIRPEISTEVAEFIEGLIQKSPADRLSNGQTALLRWYEVEKSIRKAASGLLPNPGAEPPSDIPSRAPDTDILKVPASSISHREPPRAGKIPHKLRPFYSTPIGAGFALVGVLVLIGMAGWMSYPKPDKLDTDDLNLNKIQTPNDSKTLTNSRETNSNARIPPSSGAIVSKESPPTPAEKTPGSKDPPKSEAPSEGQERYANRFGMSFVIVKPGKFRLGGTGGNRLRREEMVGKEFFIGVHEVTQEQWQKVTGENPSHFAKKGEGNGAVKDIPDEEVAKFPVEMVSWNDAKAFVDRLNLLDPHPDWEYRIPTEIEWEYACRGGHLMNAGDDLMDYYGFKPSLTLAKGAANINEMEPNGRPKKVGSYIPNVLGLYDMHGNVAEWCADRFVPKNKTEIPEERIIKGGSWASPPEHSRAGATFTTAQNASTWALGFRVILARKAL